MIANDEIAQQIERIKYTFQHALYTATHEGNEIILRQHIDESPTEFRGVAYEGLAMALALKDFEKGTLQGWRSLTKWCDPHYLSHVHVGLGWGISKQNLSSLVFIDDMDSFMRARVLDGYGYYDGSFRHRMSIQKKERSAAITASDFAAYDQGLGRSIWYLAKADCAKVWDVIETFAPERRGDLWRGIGTASVYVGNCNEEMLRDLFNKASSFANQLAVGALVAAKARFDSNSMTKTVQLACKIWCNLPIEKVAELVIKTEEKYKLKENAYFKFVMELRTELSHFHALEQ